MRRLWTSSRYWAMGLLLFSLPFAACSPYKQAMKGSKKERMAQQEQLLREYQTKLLRLKEDSMELARQADELVRMLGESQLKERRNAQKLYRYSQIIDKATLYQQQLEYIRRQIVHTLLTHEIDNIQVIKEKDGVRITILDELLFPTGSARISAEGQRAIKYLSETLSEIAGINIIIEGHTDNVPLRGHPLYKSNWELSLARASEVGRYMASCNFPQDKVAISGKGDRYPLADNSTPEGRRINRRTDIIVTPDWSAVFNLILEGIEEGNSQNTIVMPVRYPASEDSEKKNRASLNDTSSTESKEKVQDGVIYGTPIGKIEKIERKANHVSGTDQQKEAPKVLMNSWSTFFRQWDILVFSYCSFGLLWQIGSSCYDRMYSKILRISHIV
jgi:chemotaxis protein MotB